MPFLILKHKLMKRIFTIFTLVVLALPLWAAWLSNVPVTIKQPDGTSLNLLSTGDEFYNWVHDSEGFTVVRNADGYLVYALLENGMLIPSDYRVGQVSPSSVGLTPGLNISPEKMLAKRNTFLEMTRDKEKAGGVVKSTADAEGNFNNIVIYIRFADQNEFIIDTSVYLDMFNKNEDGYNSMFNYFQMVSYGTLFLTSTAYPVPPTNIVVSYQDEHPRNYYEPYNAVNNPDGYIGDERTAREHLLLKNAVEYIADEVPESLDLDYNNDGNVDNAVFIVKGGTGAWADLLWPHRWSLFAEEAYIHGKRVWDFNFQLESSLNSSGVGVLCHEMYHSLSAPDLYHYSSDGFTPVGRWDIMEQNTNPPQSMGAYMKYMYGGWIDNMPEITESGYYTLNPVTNAENNIFKIASPNHEWEYFVVEYRKKEGTFESQIPGSGLIVYRINGLHEGEGNASGPPDEVYIYRPGGTNTVNGGVSNGFFSLESGRTEISNTTDPRLFLTNDDFGGIEISDVSSAGETISFFVNLPGEPQAQFVADATQICPGQVVVFSDLSAGLPESYLWSFTPNTVTFVDGTNANSESPKVVFEQAENYSVTLTVDNEYGESSVTLDNYIGFESSFIPYFVNFESGDLKSESFYVVNPDENRTWNLMPATGNGGNLAAGMHIRNYFGIGERDAMITPPIDFTGYSNMDLQFEYAYAKYFETYTDSLIVYVSADCGSTWERVFAGGDNGTGNFATAPRTAEEFIPATIDDWCGHGYGAPCITLNLNEFLGQEKVRIKFEAFSQLGNNLYIDNVMVAPNVAIEQMDEKAFSVSPNPSHGYFRILGEGIDVVEIQNILGLRMYYNTYKSSDSAIDIQTNSWKSGVYLIKINNTLLQKIVVE